MAIQTTTITAPVLELPHIGYSRFKQIQAFLPVSRETWRKMVRAQAAPQPIYLGSRCAMYSNAEIHLWLNDPVNYKVEVNQ